MNESNFGSPPQYLALCKAPCCYKPKSAKFKTFPGVNSQMETHWFKKKKAASSFSDKQKGQIPNVKTHLSRSLDMGFIPYILWAHTRCLVNTERVLDEAIIVFMFFSWHTSGIWGMLVALSHSSVCSCLPSTVCPRLHLHPLTSVNLAPGYLSSSVWKGLLL